MKRPEVFIVEDDDLFALLHSAQVIKSGLAEDPACFRNGLEAINGIERKLDDSNLFLLLLDINMPVMNGWELLDLIQERPYKDRIIVAVVSSSINESDRRKAFSYPQVISFIQKPFRREECLELMALPQLAHFYPDAL